MSEQSELTRYDRYSAAERRSGRWCTVDLVNVTSLYDGMVHQ
jgi:hypothetical protein